MIPKGISPNEFETYVLALEGTQSKPHFDRIAFKVRRNFATLAPSGGTANLYLTLDEQQLRCSLQPELFQRIPNAWGDRGWTQVNLEAIDKQTLMQVLQVAWQIGASKSPPAT